MRGTSWPDGISSKSTGISSTDIRTAHNTTAADYGQNIAHTGTSTARL